VTRKFISNNRSKIAIILSLLIHSVLLLSTKSDKFLGSTNTPLKFKEIEIITGAGESINNSRSNKVIKKGSKSSEEQKSKKSNTTNSTNLISNISSKSKENNQKIKKNEQKDKKKKRKKNELANPKKESIVGNNSNKPVNKPLSGKLKGKGIKQIICKKCIEPVYSQQSIRKGLEGITIVKATIDIDGIVEDAIIIRSSGHEDIDNASIQAAFKSTFQPITSKSTINIRYEHKIKTYR